MSILAHYVVTAADSKYFNLVRQMVESLRKAKLEADRRTGGGEIPKLRVVVLDIGLQPHEIRMLCDLSTELAGFMVHSYFTRDSFFDDMLKPEYKRWANISFLDRCRLPSLLREAGYVLNEKHTVTWLDADTWIQDWTALRDFFTVLGRGKGFYVPEVDRAYAVNLHHLTISPGWTVGNYLKYFGEETASQLSQVPMINSGVVGAPVNHPLWSAWESSTLYALDHNEGKPEFGIDQIALNYAIYSQVGAIMESLPSTYNWLCTHALPVVGPEGLAHPFFPHERLKVVHLLDNLKWQRTGIRRISANGEETGDSLHLDYDTFRAISG